MLLRVACQALSVTRHTSHVTRHKSHVTRHTSHVTRHRDLPSAKVMAGCELVVENACRAAASCVLKRAQVMMMMVVMVMMIVMVSICSEVESATSAVRVMTFTCQSAGRET